MMVTAKTIPLYSIFLFCLGYFVFAVFWGAAHLWHMEVPRVGVKSELQLLAYASAIAMPDLSCICHLRRSSCSNLDP